MSYGCGGIAVALGFGVVRGLGVCGGRASVGLGYKKGIKRNISYKNYQMSALVHVELLDLSEA